MYKYSVVILLCVSSTFTQAFDFSRINLAYLYDPSALVRVQHSQVQEDQDLHLYLQVTSKTALSYNLKCFTQQGYEDADHREISFRMDTLMSGMKSSRFLMKIALDSLDKLVVVQWSNSASEFYFPISVNVERGKTIRFEDEPARSFLKSYPVLQETEEPYAYAYSMDFGMADPAFGNMRELSPTLEPDSLFVYDTALAYQDWHFYFLQYDTTTAGGRGFLKTPGYFPRLRKIEELLGPVRYLCSTSEFRTIADADNPKFAFEQFWIRNAGSKTKAKNAIGSFYNKATWSNELFTNYKPGWKTDKGMIYLIFGKPDQVYQTNRKERWLYLDGLEFEFIRISTLFAPTLYTLIRKQEYRDRWIQRIGQIRKGN